MVNLLVAKGLHWTTLDFKATPSVALQAGEFGYLLRLYTVVMSGGDLIVAVLHQ